MGSHCSWRHDGHAPRLALFARGPAVPDQRINCRRRERIDSVEFYILPGLSTQKTQDGPDRVGSETPARYAPCRCQCADRDALAESEIIRREDRTSIHPFGVEMKVMMAAVHTGGTCSVLVGELKPSEVPPHLHRDFAEYRLGGRALCPMPVRRRHASVRSKTAASALFSGR